MGKEQELDNEKWVNIEDVAEHLSVTPDTVRTWVRSGKLPANKVGKRYKFRLSEIDKLVLEGKL
ncbi:MAG: helix-turn-helix domain-containing protein [Oribacterium sp.]|jgi:excisionase family DNA binding protein|uniref:helix-turn-helix domain-containing protein n=1 Tax=Butyrivibrio sp. TaxID=28121 RepID=UPI001B193C55|nr:helix-turn-helix domain-containing protein [Butyrivibrio sp.]MBO5597626.1 helix-turn-helix domain-containing protein [Oribacterium sp.]MBO6242834.1 helix-turn-helix domain-containing protein [Butyrivibrio sp.]MBO6307756.1 helix-turn-helix domain-containing protein [Oribacterium sp.]MBP3803850.1 helix-turn-helix domain-containing protein [Oribacterium sp.]